MHAYHSALLLMQSLPLWSLGRRLSHRDATRIAPHSTDKARRACRCSGSSTGDGTRPERQIRTLRVACCRADSKLPKKYSVAAKTPSHERCMTLLLRKRINSCALAWREEEQTPQLWNLLSVVDMIPGLGVGDGTRGAIVSCKLVMLTNLSSCSTPDPLRQECDRNNRSHREGRLGLPERALRTS